ncbi:hypothetical protein PPL_11517 [Heterostelium album PN500]|uniref:KNTC1 first ARM-repeats domain-containing protein n=1 Tax=Heterostelium pallidum (strain ATCC 26659 / Pp 5 / PN500) TaxID=670386 RepID=D3BTM0_HETP5|nr:hypothetical protein PPL_11517 [Heterostelium album PN500]EFA75437.1 hypothetical protein PPL_11517 [Heterostelium album PN500]|eukprot:XP_020427571.1 hypothetical protein PPL_11517 [Heterostelium album PN500]
MSYNKIIDSDNDNNNNDDDDSNEDRDEALISNNNNNNSNNFIDDIESDESVYNSDDSHDDGDDHQSSFSRSTSSLNKSLKAIKQIRSNNINNNNNSISTASSSTNNSNSNNSINNNNNNNINQELILQQQKKKILYTLWFVDPEWTDEQLPSEEELDNEEYYNQYVSSRRKSKIYEKYYYFVQFLDEITVDEYSVSKQIKAKTVKAIASTHSQYKTTECKAINFQADKESQWQRLCFSPDNSIMAFSTSGCTIYIISIQGENTVNILSPSMLGLNPKDGIVDLAIRYSICLLSNQRSLVKCFELLVMGYDMILRRFHIPMLNQEFTVHPVNNSQDSVLSDGCNPATLPIDMKGIHHEVGCMDYCQATDILAIGGNRKSKKSKGGSSIKPFVSFWKLSDEEPYFRLLNKPSVTGVDFDTSVDGTTGSGSSSSGSGMSNSVSVSEQINLHNQQQQQQKHNISFSNDGSQILGLDLNGTIYLWNTPLSTAALASSTSGSGNQSNVKPIKIWTTETLSKRIWERSSSAPSSVTSKNVVDISWWSNDQIIAANRCGEFVIFSMLTSENCLLHDPETVSSTQPPILTRSHNGRFFILETSGSIHKKPSFFALSQEYLHEKIGRPSVAAYKYIYRYFYGDHPDDQDPFDYNIQRIEGNQNINGNNNNSNNNNSQLRLNDQDNNTQQIERRIIRFQSTTPEQLFKAKVAQKEYNNAIIIAEHYGLDKDLVHQKRWSKSQVSSDTIKSYLSKVQDLNWILWECHNRIPLNFESTKLLLEYALEKSSKIINENSSIESLKEHKDLIVHRNIIVNYLNRLIVYKEIYGTSFDALDFLRFRGCNLVLAAMEYANSEHFKAIEVLFTYYSRFILPYRLQILSMIPETTDPAQYEKLLPDSNNYWTPKKSFEQDWCQSASIYKNVLEGFDYEKHTDSNYLKEMLVNSLKSDYEDIRGTDKVNDIYAMDYVQLPFDETTLITSLPSGVLTTEDIAKWYSERALEIDRKSGQIDNALSLITIGIKEKEVTDQSLDELNRLIQQVSIIIYDTNADISLDRYQTLSPQNKLALLLNDSNSHTIYNNIRNRLDTFKELYPPADFDDLLENYFVDKAKHNHIGLVRYYITTLKQNKPDQCGSASTLSIALNSIANVQLINGDSLSHMEAIIADLPERSVVGGLSPATQRLLNLRSDYSRYIRANKILLKYNATKSISFFQDTKERSDEVALSLLQELCRHAKKSQWKNANYRSMFSDFNDIKQIVFYSVDSTVLYCQIVKFALAEGKFSLAREYFDGCGPDKVEQLVVAAAKELYNSASSYNSPNMAEAQLCLELIKPPTQRIVRELNLLKATEIMTNKFHYSKIPLQIRLILDKGLSKTSPRVGQQQQQQQQSSTHSLDIGQEESLFGENQGKFELIQSLIDSCQNAYQDVEEILHLSALLCDWVDRDLSKDVDTTDLFIDDHIIVEVMLARKAIQLSDFSVAFRICKMLMSEPKKNIPSKYKEIYRVCSSLALDGHFSHLEPRLELLSYCLVYCDQDDLTRFLEAYQELELRSNILESSQRFQSVADNSLISQLKSSVDENGEQTSVYDKLMRNENELAKYIKQLASEQPSEIRLEPPFSESLESITTLINRIDCDDKDDDDDNDEASDRLYQQQNELMFHLSQLIQFIGSSNHNTQDDNLNVVRFESTQEILLLLSKYAIHHGFLKNALSYYLSVADQSHVDRVFGCLVESSQSNPQYQTSLERVIRLACYYYSLRLLSAVAARDTSTTPNSICSLFNISVASVIESAFGLASLPGEDSDSATKDLVSNVQKYHKMLLDSIQAKEFSEVNYNVDFNRFKEDPVYKRDTIFQFAMTNDAKSFQTALSMASRYGITREEVLEKHVHWKIIEDRSGFTNTLLTNEDISSLSAIKHHLIQHIFDKIDGCDYERLLLFNELLGRFDTGDQKYQVANRNKKKLLTLLKSPKNTINKIYKPLNFKLLIENTSYDPYVDGLKSLLSEENIAFCCNLINILQNIRSDVDLIQNYTVSKMYRQLINNIIQHEEADTDIVSVVLKYRKQLDDVDLVEVYEMIAYGDYSNRLTMEERIDALKQVTNTDQVTDNPELLAKLQQLLSHLEVINKLQHLEPKINLSSLNIIENYKNALIEAFKYSLDIKSVNSKQLDTIIPTLIQKNLEITPSQCEQVYQIIKGSTDVSDTIASLLKYYQTSISNLLEQLGQSNDHIQQLVLSESIKRIIDNFKAGTKWHSEQKIFLEELREFAYDTNQPMECRILIFEILKSTPTLYDRSHQDWMEQDLIQVKQHKTKEIIKETWKSADVTFKEMEITTPESAIPLFNKLISNSDTFQHVSYLSDLLAMWSNAQKSDAESSDTSIHVLHNCWLKLFLAFIPFFEGNNKAVNQFLRIRLDQIKQYPMEKSEELEILEKLNNTHNIIYYKFGILSNYRGIQVSTVNDLLTFTKNTFVIKTAIDSSAISYCPHHHTPECHNDLDQFIQNNQQLFQIIYSSGFTYMFVDTPLYDTLVNLITLYNNNFNNPAQLENLLVPAQMTKVLITIL